MVGRGTLGITLSFVVAKSLVVEGIPGDSVWDVGGFGDVVVEASTVGFATQQVD